MSRETRALVEHYLREWDSRGWAAAYHSLIELGPRVLPEIEARFAESVDPAFRAALVQIAHHLHSDEALQLLAGALRDDAPEVWKEALDGLVDLATAGAIELLERARTADPPGETELEEWAAWLEEALEQARAARAARGGAA